MFQEKIQATTYFPLTSIIGADGLNGRVRNGNGCDPVAMVTWKKYMLLKELVEQTDAPFQGILFDVPMATSKPWNRHARRSSRWCD